jgi:hypothetical protein
MDCDVASDLLVIRDLTGDVVVSGKQISLISPLIATKCFSAQRGQCWRRQGTARNANPSSRCASADNCRPRENTDRHEAILSYLGDIPMHVDIRSLQISAFWHIANDTLCRVQEGPL